MANDVNLGGAGANMLALNFNDFDDPDIWGPGGPNDPDDWLVEPGANLQLADLLDAGGPAAGGGPLAAREPPAADRKRD